MAKQSYSARLAEFAKRGPFTILPGGWDLNGARCDACGAKVWSAAALLDQAERVAFVGHNCSANLVREKAVQINLGPLGHAPGRAILVVAEGIARQAWEKRYGAS